MLRDVHDDCGRESGHVATRRDARVLYAVGVLRLQISLLARGMGVRISRVSKNEPPNKQSFFWELLYNLYNHKSNRYPPMSLLLSVQHISNLHSSVRLGLETNKLQAYL